jgi:subtilase family serine protease
MIRRIGFSFAVAFALVMAIGSVASQAQSVSTRHTRDAVVSGEAKSIGRLPASQTMNVGIVLALRHQPELDNFLREIYDPSSSSYRQFLTVKEFTERFGPSQEDYDAVIRFAAANGFKVIGGSRDGMNVQLRGAVASVEKAFHVTMGLYQHPTENRKFFAPDREPSVDLPFQLWHISGLDNYSIPRTALMHKDIHLNPNVVKGSCPGGYYCGSDMRGAYYNGGTLTGTGQNIALLELAGSDLADLTTYYANVKQTEPYTPTLISTGGYSTTCLHSSGCQDPEQTLDMTQAMGMAPGSKMLYMYVCGDADGSGTFDETACLGAMSTTTDAPLSAQISCSWTWQPADPSTDDPYYQKFAAQGQNFFVASGDSGAYPNSSGFYYPAEDAYVTAVGGTDLQVTQAGGPWSSETAWSRSGGGISPDSIPIPAWQQIAGVINSSNKGSKTLRNVPDVAGEANFDFYVCSNQAGCGGGWGGTSFAAPMWAGYMALVNQQAIANGNPPLGFVNPAVYNIGVGSGYSTAFHDITSGGNGGFTAVAGYDLVTGWGSPNGSGLINALAGSGGGGPAISFTPASLKFGKTLVGVKSAAKAVVVKNTGTATLNITTIATSGDFALATVKATKKVTPCVNGSAVAAGGSCEIKVTFTPTQKGTRTGAVSFTDNAPGSPQQVPLTGTGK